MRISDWSSDVCSSDLALVPHSRRQTPEILHQLFGALVFPLRHRLRIVGQTDRLGVDYLATGEPLPELFGKEGHDRMQQPQAAIERKSVVKGTGVPVR